jgi:hypothetical protein
MQESGKRETNRLETGLNSIYASPQGEPQKLIDPDELTPVSDSGE